MFKPVDIEKKGLYIMKKKIFMLIVAFAFVFSSVIPSYAAKTNDAGSIKDLIDIQYLVSASSDRVEFSRTTLVGSAIKANSLTSVQSFAKENLALIPENETAANEIMQVLSSGGSNYEYLNDISGTIKIYTTVYYDIVSGYNGLSYTDMSKITGGWTMSGANGTTVVDGYIAYMQSGFRASNGSFINQTASTNKTSSSWTITVPSSWQGVIPGDAGNIQCNYQVTMQRPSGYTWTTDMLQNHIE